MICGRAIGCRHRARGSCYFGGARPWCGAWSGTRIRSSPRCSWERWGRRDHALTVEALALVAHRERAVQMLADHDPRLGITLPARAGQDLEQMLAEVDSVVV